ncbi:hypothetical protein MVEN_02417300 [Mycena venus]|uniref:Uncharacterized protein n=1 Tax=Mycena venus TaxID=2733690 RepID=A0A8H6WYG6_9AGAR|nr:hypothetical protein MVEN_02417300 [Mycena venus]
MSAPFTNISDPAGVKALLDRLRASQAWQDLVNTPPSAPEQQQQTAAPSGSSDATPGSSTSSSVAALLSQLNSAPAPAPVSVPTRPVPGPSNASRLQPHLSPSRDYDYASYLPPPPPVPVPAPAPYVQPEDVRSLTFQQALPRLAQLSDDPAVVSAIQKLKQEQDKLERELWAERTAIREKYEEKVKIAKVKAGLIGAAGLSKHEADSKPTSAISPDSTASAPSPAWDGLVTNQQTALAQLRVPTMFSTAVKGDRERQQRVIQVLEGIVGPAPQA